MFILFEADFALGIAVLRLRSIYILYNKTSLRGTKQSVNY